MYVSNVRPQFMGEKVRFTGRRLEHYVSSDEVDDNRLKRKETHLILYRCPGGCRVQRT